MNSWQDHSHDVMQHLFIGIHRRVWHSSNCHQTTDLNYFLEHGQAFLISGCYSNTEFLWGWFNRDFAQHKGICLICFQLLTGKLVKRSVKAGEVKLFHRLLSLTKQPATACSCRSPKKTPGRGLSRGAKKST